MSVLKIARMGHPVLSEVAAEVADPTSPKLRRLVADMIETLADADGAGLAAPQVHVSLRLVLFQSPADSRLDRSQVDPLTVAPLTVLINPKITVLDPQTEGDWEGCLSLAGLRGFVQRPRHIRYSGVGVDGRAIEREAKGFHARVVQHECDHLDGILYPQRMTDLKKFIFESEARHWHQRV